MEKVTEKTVFLTRGAPGSGKSFWIKSNLGPEAVICSADDYHYDEAGNYNWKPENMSRAHEWCRKNFVAALEKELPLVVVDNTNTRHREMKPYMDLAEQYGYNVRVVRLECPLEKLLGRNVHNVPDETVKKMFERIQPWPGEEVVKGY